MYILYVFHFFFTEYCGFKSLNTRKVILFFSLFCFAKDRQKKKIQIFLPEYKKWPSIMSWKKKDKDNTVCYFPFLLNKGANKRASLSSIFNACSENWGHGGIYS